MAGPIFETAVLSEIIKTLLSRGEEPHIHFFRTASGTEVDFVVEIGGRLIPVEVKSSATPRSEMATDVHAFKKTFPRKAEPGYVVHTGSLVLPLGQEVTAIPFTAL
jgi:hypothetical protein